MWFATVCSGRLIKSLLQSQPRTSFLRPAYVSTAHASRCFQSTAHTPCFQSTQLDLLMVVFSFLCVNPLLQSSDTPSMTLAQSLWLPCASMPYKYPQQHPHHLPTFPYIYRHLQSLFSWIHSPTTTLTHSSMNTHPKNKSAHPARPIMTPAQLSAAGIPLPKSKRPKKQTKDQQIAALREDLRLVQEMARTVWNISYCLY